MPRRAVFPDGTFEKMIPLLQKAKTASELRFAQTIMLGADGACAKDVSIIVGFCVQYVREIWKEYRDHPGDDILMHEALETDEDFKENQKVNPRLVRNKNITNFKKRAQSSGLLSASKIEEAYKKQQADKKDKDTVCYLVRGGHGENRRLCSPKKLNKEKQNHLKEFIYAIKDTHKIEKGGNTE